MKEVRLQLWASKWSGELWSSWCAVNLKSNGGERISPHTYKHKCQKHGKNAQVSGDPQRSAKTQASEKDEEWVWVIKMIGMELSILHYLWDQTFPFIPPKLNFTFLIEIFWVNGPKGRICLSFYLFLRKTHLMNTKSTHTHTYSHSQTEALKLYVDMPFMTLMLLPLHCKN